MLSGQIGSPACQPGQFVPGFAITQGRVQWLGPFRGTAPNVGVVNPGDTRNVGVALAQQLVNSDPTWWVGH